MKMLDDNIVLYTSEFSEGANHCGSNMLFLLAGSAGGQWRTGRHLNFMDASSSYRTDHSSHNLFASILQACGSSANHFGNEGRFVNDYRNTGRRANVEFRLRRDRRGELRQGIFVAAKEGVTAGDELLISYGKSFWRSRVDGSMEEFITRRPGEAASAATAPSRTK